MTENVNSPVQSDIPVNTLVFKKYNTFNTVMEKETVSNATPVAVPSYLTSNKNKLDFLFLIPES